jgi:hypothetical protein
MHSRVALTIGVLLCLAAFFNVSDVSGQTIGPPQPLLPGPWSDQAPGAAGWSGRTNLWSAVSFTAGWLTTPNKIHVGYDGLVPPGGCISSFFVYPLSGLQVGASAPIRLTDQYALRVYGTYLIPNNPQAGQEITWITFPPGTREWRTSNSQWYKIGGEALYRMSPEMGVVGGFRLESLLTNFGDPNPDYLFTIPTMEAQTTIAVYEPYVGIRLQPSPGAGGLTLQAVGFPSLFTSIEHLNVCNNNGVPFAHTGNRTSYKGSFLEISAEYSLPLFSGAQAAAFLDWNLYQGHCDMTIDRHEGGANPNVTSATVAWSHDISSLVVGGKVDFSWNLPF